jgi:protoheme IX farnesyltransferase
MISGNIKDWFILGKARIQLWATSASLICMWVAGKGVWETSTALHLTIGLTLVSTASAIINQVVEVEVDKKMPRTANRPLPTGRVKMKDATLIAIIFAFVGLFWLGYFLNYLCAWLALIMLMLYDFVYTPLKQVTPLNTLIGAIPGAMPLLVGYSAAGNGLDIIAGMLFLILFLWQLPHFFAISWLYKKDYEAAGMYMLSSVDKSGAAAGRQAIHYALSLLPVSLAPTLFQLTGLVYFYGALTLSLLFLSSVIMFSRQRIQKTARIVLWSSIAYLPLLFSLIVIDYQNK